MSAIIDKEGGADSFLRADELPHVSECAGGVINGKVVDGGAIAFGLHNLLVGGVLVGRVA